jgi:carboxylate-amine ligase
MQPMTFGVEEEFLVVDVHDGELVPRSKELLPEARLVLGDDVSPELNLCQIEVGTPVCRHTDELRRHLRRLRRGLCLAGSEVDLQIVATGTHPFTSWTEQEVDLSSERFSRIEDVYKIVARQQVICGCHVHVGIDDPDLAIQVMNHVRPHLGALLALSANSPFWHGIDTGYDSYRMQVWERWPTAGLPPELPDRAAYDRLVARLEGVEAIEDATFLYWHVRPSVQYPTLEFRIGDVCLHVDDTVGYAALIRGLAWSTAERVRAGTPPPMPEPDLMLSGIWRAGRYGLSDSLLSPVDWCLKPAVEVLSETLDAARPGLEVHGDWELVSEWVGRMGRDGNGASRQRQTFHRYGDARSVIGRIASETVPG